MAKAPKVFILNGPNLNMLGKRQPDVYGSENLADIARGCRRHARAEGLKADGRRSNSAAERVDWTQAARKQQVGPVGNPGACSQTAVAIVDAFLAALRPLIGVHFSNIHRREAFRHRSFVSKVADAVLCGLGSLSYLLAPDAGRRRLSAQQET